MNLRVFVVEPEALRRRLVCESASQAPGVEVVGSTASLVEAAASESLPPEIILVDVDLVPEERASLGDLAERYPGACFVLFGQDSNINALLGSLPVPLRGYLSFNHLSKDEFIRSLEIIAYGGAVIEPLSAQRLLEYLREMSPRVALRSEQSPGPDLTDRELEVLQFVRLGLSNKEIAVRLHISMGTVRAHLRSIFRKLDVTSRAGAAASPLASPFARKARLAG
jgi:DNA-binding NarL/FixJ family response regulator